MPTTAQDAATKFATMRKIPRTSKIQKRIVAILNDELNNLIAVANAAVAAEDTDADLMLLIDKAYPSPHKVTDEFINQVLVAVGVNGETKGGGIIEKSGMVSVFIIDHPLATGETVYPIWDRGDAVVAVLEQYKIGYYEGADKIWNELLFHSMEMLPEQFGDYSGVTVNFSYKQAAAFNANYWPESAG